MPPSTRKGAKAPEAAPEAKPEAKADETPKEPRVRKAEKATFLTEEFNDKRAQYARLVVFNYMKANAKKYGLPKDATVDSITNAQIQAGATDLVHGTELDGKDGLAFLQSLTEEGSVTGRPLTDAYCMEVRPFIRQMKFAPNGPQNRRGAKPKVKNDEPAGEGTTADKEPAPAAA